MWEYEYAVETSAPRAAIWRLWTDVQNWGSWNDDIEKIELRGPFAEGSTISMTPVGQDTVELRLTDVSANEQFVDEAEVGDVVVRTIHRLEQLEEDRVRITYRTEITGPAAGELGPEIGPHITADFPQTIASLIDRATT
jgi:hypothetical protein